MSHDELPRDSGGAPAPLTESGRITEWQRSVLEGYAIALLESGGWLPAITRGADTGRTSGKVQMSLLLDDCIFAIRGMRREFKLPTPSFGLKEIEDYPTAKEVIADSIKAAFKKHGSEICVRPGILFPEAGQEPYFGEPVGPCWNVLRFRLRPDWADRALREVLEMAFQTIARLPPRFPELFDPSRRIKSVASRLKKCAADVDAIRIRWPELAPRLEATLDYHTLERFSRDWKRAGQTLASAGADARRMGRLIRLNPKNPQVSLALYLADFFEPATGRKRYILIDTLTEAAFSAA
jgi:hypothetical protein